MPDRLFKQNCRFDKVTVRSITSYLHRFLAKPNNRGSPLSPEDLVATALLQLSGASFQRSVALEAGGISQSTARSATIRVVTALVRIRKEWIRFPNEPEMLDTALRFEQKFGLPDIFGAVDGCHIRFQKCPRRIPAGFDAQDFICRKHFFSLNVQIVSNDRYIYDVDCGWPGSTHDARVWRASDARVHLELDRSRFMIAADSAYPISLKVMKHYETPLIPMHRRFNVRLNGLRTISSENVYARLKQRFPILREMRSDFQTSQRIVIACCVLHNIAEKFKDELPADVDHLDPYRRPMADVDLYDLPAEILIEPRSVEVDAAKAKRDEYCLAFENSRHRRRR